MSFHRPIDAVLAVLITCASALGAQDKPTRMSLDGAVGLAHGWGGGSRVDRTLVAADLVVVVRFATQTRNSFFAGFEALTEPQINGDKVCVVNPVGGCVPQYPDVAARSVVVGREWQMPYALCARLFAGPGYYSVHFNEPSATNHSFGASVGGDIAVQFDRYVALTLGTRGAWIPRVRGHSYVLNTELIGLRFGLGG